jgi:hypothetical protein
MEINRKGAMTQGKPPLYITPNHLKKIKPDFIPRKSFALWRLCGKKS